MLEFQRMGFRWIGEYKRANNGLIERWWVSSNIAEFILFYFFQFIWVRFLRSSKQFYIKSQRYFVYRISNSLSNLLKLINLLKLTGKDLQKNFILSVKFIFRIFSSLPNKIWVIVSFLGKQSWVVALSVAEPNSYFYFQFLLSYLWFMWPLVQAIAQVSGNGAKHFLLM